jgi:hypothetical protein
VKLGKIRAWFEMSENEFLMDTFFILWRQFRQWDFGCVYTIDFLTSIRSYIPWNLWNRDTLVTAHMCSLFRVVFQRNNLGPLALTKYKDILWNLERLQFTGCTVWLACSRQKFTCVYDWHAADKSLLVCIGWKAMKVAKWTCICLASVCK